MNSELKVLLILLREKEISRKKLEKLLNLSPSSTTYVLAKLRDLLTISELASNFGKAPHIIKIDKDAWTNVVVNVGREKLTAVKFNAHGEEIESVSLRLKEEQLSNCKIKDILVETLMKFENYDSIGFGFSGKVEKDIVNSKILNLKNFKVKDVLKSAEIEVPYIAISDVEAIAAYHSKTKNSLRTLVINYGIGIGACYYEYNPKSMDTKRSVIDIGHLYAGGNEKCYCGALGCLETVASEYAVLRDFGEINVSFEEFIHNEDFYFDKVNKLRSIVKHSHNEALKYYDKVFVYLATFIGNLALVYDVNEVTIHGEGTNEWLCANIESRAHSISKNFSNIKFVYGERPDSVLRGLSYEAAVEYLKKKYGRRR